VPRAAFKATILLQRGSLHGSGIVGELFDSRLLFRKALPGKVAVEIRQGGF
jgi:hypothetical protein